ncbi:MAG: site-specific integrase [Bacteroidota bacterium]
MPKSAKIPVVRFNLKSHNKKDDTTPVLIILVYRYNGNRILFSTGLKVAPKHWNIKKQRLKYAKSGGLHVRHNQLLNDLEEEAIRIFTDHDYGNISPKDFKNKLAAYLGKEELSEAERPPTLFEFIERFIDERLIKPNSKRGTWKIFRTVSNHLKKYAEEKELTLDYSDMTAEFKHDFESWLYQSPRKHSTNYASKVFEILRQFLNEATRRGYNNSIKYKEYFSIRKEKVQNISLSFEELRLLYDFDLSNDPRLERVRDLFLIGAYSGLRYSDFTRIQAEHIFIREGIKLIKLFTKKTDTEVIIPVSEELEMILRKYDYASPKAISNQKMNTYLKELCQTVGLTEKINMKRSKAGERIEEVVEKWRLVTTHTARRSFATNYYKLGIPASQLMLITGHATERQFMKYINMGKIDNAVNIARLTTMLKKNNHLRAVK